MWCSPLQVQSFSKCLNSTAPPLKPYFSNITIIRYYCVENCCLNFSFTALPWLEFLICHSSQPACSICHVCACNWCKWLFTLRILRRHSFAECSNWICKHQQHQSLCLTSFDRVWIWIKRFCSHCVVQVICYLPSWVTVQWWIWYVHVNLLHIVAVQYGAYPFRCWYLLSLEELSSLDAF